MNLSVKSSELKSKITHRVALIPLLLLFPSFSAFAAVCNDDDYVSSTIKPQEYSQWLAGSFNSTITAAGNSNTSDDVLITGSMTKNGTSQSINGAVNTTSPNVGAFFIKQNMDRRNDTNTITYKFDRPILNLNISVYDIDRQLIPFTFFDYNWIDKVQFVAKNKSNENVLPIFSNKGDYVTSSGNTVSGDGDFGSFGICSDNEFNNNCKVTASFNQPISELSIEYGNTNGARTNPADQNIEIVFDNFCVKLPDYTFSGTVFNDNGGIIANEKDKQNILSKFTGKASYFNGIFNSDEKGIWTSGLKVELTDCKGNILDNKSVDITSSGADVGKYSITVSRNKLVDSNKIDLKEVCLVEKEPDPWEAYSVDTTTNNREVLLVDNTYNYSNIDFGEVNAYNTALVLKKAQHIHDCKADFTYPTNTDNAEDLTIGFGDKEAKNVAPGKCIAYRVIAYNRGHVELQSIQITDKLQTKSVKSTFSMPFPIGNPTVISANSSALPNETIISNKFNLAKTPFSSTTPTKAILYFNTKYGMTTDQ